MGVIEIILIGVGLAMDAFAVSVCKGLSMKKINWKKAITVGLYFGIFQALMPIIGYLLGETFGDFVVKIDHWITFILLSIIGVNMIKEALEEEQENYNDKLDFKTMSVLAIATSIDAFAIGVMFAFLQINILFAISIIGVITFIICLIGVNIGNRFGSKYGCKAEFVGGMILIIIGCKILLEHLEIIS